MKEKEVRYYFAEQRGLEVVRLKGSRFFYPEHSHVSTYTASLVLSGALRLEAGSATTVHGPDSFFVIPPYEPHALSSSGGCETVTICMGDDLLRALSGGEKSLNDCLRALSGALPAAPWIFTERFRRMLDRLFSSVREPGRRERDFVGAVEQRLLLHPEDSLGLYADIRGLPLRAAADLMDHDFGVRQRFSFALRAGSQQEGPHGGGKTHADGRHIALKILHGIVYRQARADRAAGAVDVEIDILIGIVAL